MVVRALRFREGNLSPRSFLGSRQLPRLKVSWQENILGLLQYSPCRLFSLWQAPVFPLFSEREHKKFQEFVIFWLKVSWNTDSDIRLVNI
jgi:hypothetical protein